LAARGHDQHVMVPGAGPLCKLLEPHAAIHIVPNNPWVMAGYRATVRQLAYNLLVAHRSAVRLIRRVKPDVIITETYQMPTAALAARSQRIPHVWFLHGLPNPVHQFSPLLLGTSVTLRAVNRLSDEVLCVSEAVRSDALRWVPADRLRRVQWAAEIPQVEPAKKPNGAFRLALVGRKSRDKGQHEALQALHLLRERRLDVELDLVGSGTPAYEADLQGIASRLRITPYVRFMSHTDDALALMAGADVALVCSRHDPFPRVTIEALKLGVPVVAAGDYGVLEQIQHQRTGLLYKPGKIPELAAHIEWLHTHPTSARALAQAGRAWAEARFNLQRYGADLDEAIAAARERRPARRH
jgi:glycosyltransferase involved in cell wall biosynthesis